MFVEKLDTTQTNQIEGNTDKLFLLNYIKWGSIRSRSRIFAFADNSLTLLTTEHLVISSISFCPCCKSLLDSLIRLLISTRSLVFYSSFAFFNLSISIFSSSTFSKGPETNWMFEQWRLQNTCKSRTKNISRLTSFFYSDRFSSTLSLNWVFLLWKLI